MSAPLPPPVEMLDAIGREVLRGCGEEWDELTPEQREEERDNVRQTVAAIRAAGYDVVPTEPQ